MKKKRKPLQHCASCRCTKLDLMLEELRKSPSDDDLHLIVADLQSAFDSARSYPIVDPKLYRIRCNKILTCAKIAERQASGKDLEYLQAIEGPLLDGLRGKTAPEVEKEDGKFLPPRPFRSEEA